MSKKKASFDSMHGVIHTAEELEQINLGKGSFWKGYLALKRAEAAPLPHRPMPVRPSGTSLLVKHGITSSHRGFRNDS